MLPNFRDLIDLFKRSGNVEAQSKIVELQELFVQLKEENLTLREELAALRKTQETQQTLEFDDHYYWQNSNMGRVGPYCQRCFDKEKNLVRLQPRRKSGQWDCIVCGTYVRDKNYVEVSSRVVRSSANWM